MFGLGVFAHLARRGGDYDVVHTASFPYFGLLAAGTLRRRRRYRLVVDWLELWTRDYWRDYLGRVGGWLGWRVQRACARIPQRAFCFSRLHAARLAREGVRGRGDRAAGRCTWPTLTLRSKRYVDRGARGRLRGPPHPGEAGAGDRSGARARARDRAGAAGRDLRGRAGARAGHRAGHARSGWRPRSTMPGFVEHGRVDAAMRRALCLVLPSRREGYGLVVVEACAAGTPSVVVADPDNAATELIEEGVNGFVAPSASAADLAAAILRVREGGDALRASTAAWYAENARSLSLADSLEHVAAAYGDAGDRCLRDRRDPAWRPVARRLPARAADRARAAPGRGADRRRQQRSRGPRPTVRRSSAERRNLGFAGGVVRGLEAAAGEWVLLVNDDAELEPGAVQPLLAAGRAAPRAGHRHAGRCASTPAAT